MELSHNDDDDRLGRQKTKTPILRTPAEEGRPEKVTQPTPHTEPPSPPPPTQLIIKQTEFR